MKNLKDAKCELLAPPATQATYESQSAEFDIDRELIAARSCHGMTRNDVAQGTAAPQEAMTTQESAEHEIAWFDATLDAAGFFALEHVPPVQAAMLLCGFCPHDSTESEAENCATDCTSPEDFKRLRLTFVSINKPAPRSLLDWMAVAADTGRVVHPWAQRYVKLRGLCNPVDSTSVVDVNGKSRPSGGKRWTPQKLAELKAYRESNGTKKAAEHFGISQARIRHLLPGDKPKEKGYSAFTYRSK